MRVKTYELTGAALDWAVMHCEFPENSIAFFRRWYELASFKYSSDWHQGGPIIEREFIDIEGDEYYRGRDKAWGATCNRNAELYSGTGVSPLIAAMRCYVASKLGEVVDVPDELMES